MREHTPRTRHPPDNANPPAELQSVKRGIFISTYLITLPLKAAFRIIKLETYGNYWTWP